MDYNEYRGVRSIVIAEVTKNNTEGYVAGKWERMSGCQSIGVTKNESSESKFYDNAARIVIDAEGADELACVLSILANKTRAKVDGVEYDEKSDMIINTPKKKKYFAVGYIGEKTDGTEEINIYYNGKFSGGGETHNTKDDGTESTNVEYTYTGVHTTAEIYTKPDNTKTTVKSAKFPIKGKVTEAAVFGVFTDDVSTLAPMTPDEIKALATA